MPKFAEAERPPSALRLDLKNPRMPDARFLSELDAVEYLYKNAALEELIESIAVSGWLDYEPLIVLKATNEVIEGNRRLAALRILNDGGTAAKLSLQPPVDRVPESNPDHVRIWVVDTRAAARDYIGFKHINGAFKWDSFAKAKYADEWLVEEPDLDQVSRRLGDSNNTVVRLVNGYRVLKQAEARGFDRDRVPGRFAFSHLYTALARPALREYLGLPTASGLLENSPVPAETYGPRLDEVTRWLFGQDGQRSVIKSQNPDLKHLLAVLPSKVASASLRANLNLDAAYDLVEDKGQKFSSELFDLYAQAKSVSGDLGLFDGDPDLVPVAENIARTARAIHVTLTAEAKQRADHDVTDVDE